MDQRPLFVYGTLRPGQGNHGLLAGRTVQEEPARAPGVALYGWGLPYAVPFPGASTVGTLVTITPDLYWDVLIDLDRLEGYRPDRPDRSHYLRRPRTVLTTAGATHTAWVYLAGPSFNPAGMRRIPSGDWLFASADR